MNKQKLIKYLETHAHLKFEILPEDTHYVGNCSACDAVVDAESENWIRKELSRGNDAAWCIAHVRARLGPIDAHDFLGGCSYESEDKLWEHNLEDMRRNAISELADKLTEQFETLKNIQRYINEHI